MERILTLRKGHEFYIFVYNLGDEHALLEAVTEQARNENTDFSDEDELTLFRFLIKCLCEESDGACEFLGN